MNKLFINTDGGSRGNPGPAAIGVVFFDEKENEIYKIGEYIGRATNNEAEYKAIIRALELLKKSKWYEDKSVNKEIICRLDSQLVVEQINGNYKIKQEHLLVLCQELASRAGELGLKVTFQHVPREQNKLADKMVNLALDKELKSETI